MPDELEPPSVDEAAKKLARTATVEFWVKLAGIFGTLVLVVVLLVSNIALSRHVSELSQTDARNACADRLIGYAFDAAARTLSAPPAPSKAREATAADFIAAAHRLSDADHVCSATGNRPTPLPTTPAAP